MLQTFLVGRRFSSRPREGEKLKTAFLEENKGWPSQVLLPPKASRGVTHDGTSTSSMGWPCSCRHRGWRLWGCVRWLFEQENCLLEVSYVYHCLHAFFGGGQPAVKWPCTSLALIASRLATPAAIFRPLKYFLALILFCQVATRAL